MMPWNRKEIWMGGDEQFFTKLKSALSTGQIKYEVDMKNAWSGGRGGGVNGNAGIATRYAESQKGDGIYYVYVHRYDYEKARHTMQKMDK